MRYFVYREEMVGWVEARSWGEASFKAFATFGNAVTRVQVHASEPDDLRTEKERTKIVKLKEELKHTNDDPA